MYNRLVLFGFAAWCSAGHASAAVLVQYRTDDMNPLTAEVHAPQVTPAPFTAGPGLTLVPPGPVPLNEFGEFGFYRYNPANTSFAAAVADGEAWTWGFDVTAAVNIGLTTMDLRVTRGNSGPDDFEIRGSVNGGTPISLLTYDFNDSTANPRWKDLDISGLGTVTQGDSVEFTLAAFNAEQEFADAASFWMLTFPPPLTGDPWTVRGTITAIPEPVALVLVPAGAALCLGLRRGAHAVPPQS